MEALTIPRRGAAHGPAAGGFASASAAGPPPGRTSGGGGPYLTLPGAGGGVSIDRAVLARLHDGRGGLGALCGGAAEGLPARLARSARTADSLEDFYARAKTKRYPHARLRRLAGRFPGAAGGRRPRWHPVRVLGLSGRGQELLRRMKETCALPVVVKPAQARALDETPAPSLRRRPAAQICSACASPQPGPAGGVDSQPGGEGASGLTTAPALKQEDQEGRKCRGESEQNEKEKREGELIGGQHGVKPVGRVMERRG
ncbi:MAG: nucleotidyltransferase family protein [Dysosmobacter welbionis]